VRLHPLSLPELEAAGQRPDLDALLRFGGFPQPLLTADETEHRLWQRERLSRVVRDDLRDLSGTSRSVPRSRAFTICQVHRAERHFSTGKVTVLPFSSFCSELQMP